MHLLATTFLLCSYYIVSNAFPFAPVPSVDVNEIYRKTIGDLTLSSSSILNAAQDIPRRNCKEVQDEGFTETGLYKIQPTPYSFEFVVFCDMSLRGGGWTVIMRRVNEELNFNQTWDYYTSGFGNLGGNFFLGLEKIRLLVEAGNMELHVGLGHPSKDLLAAEKAYTSARYSHFEVGSSDTNYALTVSGYDKQNSNAGDSLKQHSGHAFSTHDVDNDEHEGVTCAQRYSGGWWFHNCFESNLNGKYYVRKDNDDKGYVEDSDGIVWKTWTGEHYSLAVAVMAIRPSTLASTRV